ncbi:MAG: hypothetical protein IJ634_05675 [Bacteroidales bacterium]|nr:hypothetical protein [Bacteroidales bacterium]
MEQYQRDLQQMRYPGSESDLDREIRRVLWRSENGERRVESSPTAPARSPLSTLHSPLKWVAAAAACLLAVLLPLGLRASNDDGIRNVTIGGEHAYFACNNSCSADATIETFKTLMR